MLDFVAALYRYFLGIKFPDGMLLAVCQLGLRDECVYVYC